MKLIEQFKEMTLKEWAIGISIPIFSCGVAFVITELLIYLGLIN